MEPICAPHDLSGVPDGIRADAASLTLRPATSHDLPYIADQILDGARKGHFERRLLLPPQTELLRQELASIIQFRRRTSVPLGAVALIAQHGAEPIGHAILTEVQGTPGIELYAMALDDRFRGRGWGSALLDLLITQFLPQNGMMTARCYPRSVVMYELLVSRGFEYFMTLRSGLRVMCLNAQAGRKPVP